MAVSLLDAFPALRVAPYRRLLVALTVTQVGLHAFETTLFWTALEETGSAVLVGLLLIGLVVPVLVLTVPVGLIVDRFGPRRLLLPASIAATAMIGVAAVLTASQGLSYEVALILGVAEGTFFACWAIPAQVLGSRIVDRDQMPSAIGLSMLPSGIGSSLGGLSGGIILQAAGPVAVFALATGCLGLAAVAISGLPNLPGFGTGAGRTLVIGQLRDALGWVRTTPVALAVIALGSAVGFLAMSRFGLVPGFVRDVLGAGPAALGLMTMAGGIGTIAGTVLVDAAGRRLRRGPVLLTALGAAGLALATLGVAPHLAIALGLAGLITMSMIIYHVTSMTLLQVLAPSRMRGRVLAIFDLVRLGVVPLGSLAAGLLVPEIGVTVVFLLFGGLLVAAGAVATVACRPLVELQIEAALLRSDALLSDPPPG
jgi:predicted MFS family arabinose efflux permease